ncbi:MAG: LysR family transcriptional regulator [Bdellovibrio sp. CG10_big_fil_rev_8_21_14_0_10_47_8]|nr:MAG: LysR family transcriptional regulator [Bdellovibrio sp. CG10_big_fil_rev_8_21_14_0_10_47_8]
MDLNEVAVFIKVVQAGSFSQAARQLNMPNSTVSSKVSSLEKRLGVTLIQRTTRKLSVTEAGQAYFKTCVHGLQEIQMAEAEIATSQGDPQGLLRLTAPVELGNSVLPALISEFIQKYSKVSIEVLFLDRTVDLVAENVDLAIRAGELRDSTLKAKKLGSVYFAPFASPQYLKLHGTPKHPRELRDHQCLQFTTLGSESWKLTNSRGSIKVPVKSKVMANDLNMVRNLTTAGSGIALLPTFFCYAEVQSGKLVRILPEWQSHLAPVHFVYPAQKFVLPKLSTFIEFATPALKKNLITFEV